VLVGSADDLTSDFPLETRPIAGLRGSADQDAPEVVAGHRVDGLEQRSEVGVGASRDYLPELNHGSRLRRTSGRGGGILGGMEEPPDPDSSEGGVRFRWLSSVGGGI
jgi:hypothetical protein